MQTPLKTGLVWFRRDLRIHDNAALATALQQCERVHCVFVFDKDILDSLPSADRRVEFIQASVTELDASLRAAAGDDRCGLITLHDRASTAIPALAASLGVQAVFAGKDYEPTALERDAMVSGALRAHSISFNTLKDHVIFEEREVLTQTGKPYGVYTPYQRAWYAKLEVTGLPSYASAELRGRLLPRPQAHAATVPSLNALGFEATNLSQL
ncbi:MAG: deoxyribodipyrimidine photo-lyase, partial [Rhodoferax sp.]